MIEANGLKDCPGCGETPFKRKQNQAALGGSFLLNPYYLRNHQSQTILLKESIRSGVPKEPSLV